MKVYGFEQGKLHKIADDLADMDDGGLTTAEPHRLNDSGWMQREEVEDVFIMYEADYPPGDDFPPSEFLAYQWMFVIRAGSDHSHFILMVRDDLAEYLEAQRLLSPLVNVSTFLEIESEFLRRRDLEERQSRHTPGPR